MSEVQFMERELIEPGNQVLEVLSVEKTETYGPQVAFRFKVVGGEHDGYTFTDYATRDEDTGAINQGTKAWSIFEAALGQGFSKKRTSPFDAIVGCRLMAKVEQTKTGSRNKVEFGTIGPVPPDFDEDAPF
jgi:ribosomal protein S5